MNRFILLLLFSISIMLLYSCRKAEPKGEIILQSEFATIENWELYSEYNADDSLFTRVENDLLILKSFSHFNFCQRATHYFEQDLSAVNEIRLAIYFNQLILLEDISFHVFCSIGNHEFRAVVEKEEKSPFTLWMRLKNDVLHTNLRGVVFDKTTAKKGGDIESINFIQLSLCGMEQENEPRLIYCEIDKIMLTVN